MIVWEVIVKLEKEIKEQYPELTEKEQEDLVWMSYREIERRVLMGPTPPSRIMPNFDFIKYP